jgi:DNA-binding IclR family transcriptional regulator
MGTTESKPCADYELRFRSLSKPGRGYSFYCDASGKVDLDALSERARNNYLFARTAIGREFAMPVVQRSDFCH